MSNKRRQRGKQLPSVPLELDSQATCGGSDSASLSSKSASSSSSEHSQSTITEFDRFSDFDGFSSAPKSKSGSFTSASASERTERTGNSESSVHCSVERPILPGSDDFERAQAFATNLKSTNIDPNYLDALPYARGDA